MFHFSEHTKCLIQILFNFCLLNVGSRETFFTAIEIKQNSSYKNVPQTDQTTHTPLTLGRSSKQGRGKA